MQSAVYEMGRQQGELNMLARFYERRLQRPLAEGERTALAQRLEKLGADPLIDAALKLSGDALAAWLAEPADSEG
jgi:hypothetical protein